MMFIG
jgi:Ca2+-binding EF-hand superfamily protein